MAKIEVSAIVKALETNTDFDPTKIAMLVEEIRSISERIQQDNKDVDEQKVKYKKQIVALNARPDIESPITEFILRIPECMDDNELLGAISAVAYDFNDAQKKEASKVRNIGEALTYIKPKFFKPYHIQILTKEEIAMIEHEGEFVDRLDIEVFNRKLLEKEQSKSASTVAAVAE